MTPAGAARADGGEDVDEVQEVRQRAGVAPSGSLLRRLRRRLRPYFDSRRDDTFRQVFPDEAYRTVLDVGGRPETWDRIAPHADVLVVNINFPPEGVPEGTRARLVLGDGRDLSYADDQFDLAYSNAVIEHVGDLADQLRMADEMRRVGRAIWCQTPNRWFPVEPHLIGPLVHWLPERLRGSLLGWFLVRFVTAWGWTHRPDRAQVAEFVASIRLMSRREVQRAFPDCEIRTERVLGVLPKSFIAVRLG
ncbi:hypothetical protein GCM10028777_16540 [Angustibacter speluncae]